MSWPPPSPAATERGRADMPAAPPRYPRMVPSHPPPTLDVDAILADPGVRIVVCCGSGGVGKTTTAAALGLRAAEKHGRRTVVLTIDPARRLAQSLGLSALDNTPRQVKDTNRTNGEGTHAHMPGKKGTIRQRGGTPNHPRT